MSIAFSGEPLIIPKTSFGAYPDAELNPLRLKTVDSLHDQLVDHIEQIESGAINLDQREFLGVQATTATARFIPNKELGKGRQHSHHKLMFGQLVLKTAVDQELPTLVAVKPHDDTDTLAHEWVMYSVMNGLSKNQQSYLQLGVWTNESGVKQLVTLYEHSVQSFDNLFWLEEQEARGVTDGQLARGYELMFFSLGIMHGAGLVMGGDVKYGDATVKNLARDSNRIRFIDTELVKFVKRKNGSTIADDPQTADWYKADVMQLFASSLERANSADEPVMLTRLEKLLTDEMLIDRIYGHYQCGVSKGGERSGLSSPAHLYVPADKFTKIVKAAIDYEWNRFEVEKLLLTRNIPTR